MTDIAGNRTLSSQWNETVQFYGNQNFLEYISVDDQLTSYTYSEFHYRVIQTANWFHSLADMLNLSGYTSTDDKIWLNLNTCDSHVGRFW